MSDTIAFVIVVVIAVVFSLYGDLLGRERLEKRIVEQCRERGAFSTEQGGQFSCAAVTGGAK